MATRLRQRDQPVASAIANALVRHWLLLVNLSLGLFVLGAVAAPALMALGLDLPGRLLYILYGFTCHQLPQRSYFLFGPALVQTYSWEQLLTAGMDPAWPRQFLGTAEMGYKVGVAHRNTAIYCSLLLGGLLFAVSSRLGKRERWQFSRRKHLVPWLLALLLMAVDGGSHLVSEVSGWDFRVDNGWLRLLAGGALPSHFYMGDGVGSFNWLMRTLTGALVGLTTIWFLLPILQKGFEKRPATPAMQVTGDGAAASAATETRLSPFL